MKGLPFCAEMMLAWLAGRKTVTRRLINPQPAEPCSHSFQHPTEKWWTFGDNSGRVWKPRYLSGETVYTKETWFDVEPFKNLPLFSSSAVRYLYRADGVGIGCHHWKSSMFMPERASRSKALVVSVCAERVQEITEEDAIREGITGPIHVGYNAYRIPGDSKPRYSCGVAAYEYLWDSINAKKYPWSSNPWVWRYELNKI